MTIEPIVKPVVEDVVRMIVGNLVTMVVDLGDIHLATVDDGAMFFHGTEDFSSYAGVSGYTPFKIIFTDDSGLTAEAWCGEVGGGLATGSQLAPTSCCTDPNDDQNNTTGWGGFMTTIASVSGGRTGYCLECTENGADNPYVAKNITVTPGSLFFYEVYIKAGTESTYSIFARDTTNGVNLVTDLDNAETDWTTKSESYFVIPANCINISMQIKQITTVGAGTTIFIDDFNLKQVTDIPTTGLKLYSSQNGTTQSMTTIDTGFDPNNITKVEIYG